MERRVRYFEKAGPDNSEACLEIVKKAIADHHYRYVVAASTRGETGRLFAKTLRHSGAAIAVVTHSYGFKEPGIIEMPAEVRSEIESYGAKVYTGSMLTHSLETSLAGKFSGLYPTLLIAQSLRRFGEGPKVCCEIVMMAVDGGLIPEGEEVLAVAGTAWGADTVMVLRSAASKRFLDLKVLEILAKPRG